MTHLSHQDHERGGCAVESEQRKTVSVVFPSAAHVAELDQAAQEIGEERSTFVRKAVAERISRVTEVADGC